MNASKVSHTPTWTTDPGEFTDAHGNVFVPLFRDGTELANALGSSKSEAHEIANAIVYKLNLGEAAPSLLAACEAALRSMNTEVDSAMFNGRECPTIDNDLYDQLTAAIAAAKPAAARGDG